MNVTFADALDDLVLVALCFMHLVRESPSHRLAALAALLFVAILASLAAADAATR